jgi:hypothetical protein
VTSYNFEARNVRDHFVRHRHARALLTPFEDGAADDFAFTLISRGEGRVAFQSVNFPDRCLRHRGFEVWLEAPAGDDDAVWREDSTFFFERGLADVDGYSFRSANFPDRYLRHRDHELWVEPSQRHLDEQLRNDATFYRRPAVRPAAG